MAWATLVALQYLAMEKHASKHSLCATWGQGVQMHAAGIEKDPAYLEVLDSCNYIGSYNQ